MIRVEGTKEINSRNSLTIVWHCRASSGWRWTALRYLAVPGPLNLPAKLAFTTLSGTCHADRPVRPVCSYRCSFAVPWLFCSVSWCPRHRWSRHRCPKWNSKIAVPHLAVASFCRWTWPRSWRTNSVRGLRIRSPTARRQSCRIRASFSITKRSHGVAWNFDSRR